MPPALSFSPESSLEPAVILLSQGNCPFITALADISLYYFRLKGRKKMWIFDGLLEKDHYVTSVSLEFT